MPTTCLPKRLTSAFWLFGFLAIPLRFAAPACVRVRVRVRVCVCVCRPTGRATDHGSPTVIDSYAWVYTWNAPADEQADEQAGGQA